MIREEYKGMFLRNSLLSSSSSRRRRTPQEAFDQDIVVIYVSSRTLLRESYPRDVSICLNSSLYSYHIVCLP